MVNDIVDFPCTTIILLLIVVQFIYFLKKQRKEEIRLGIMWILICALIFSVEFERKKIRANACFQTLTISTTKNYPWRVYVDGKIIWEYQVLEEYALSDGTGISYKIGDRVRYSFEDTVVSCGEHRIRVERDRGTLEYPIIVLPDARYIFDLDHITEMIYE